MNLRRRSNYFLIALPVVILSLTLSTTEIYAQDEEDLPEGVVPPPLSVLAKEDKEKLEEEDNAKKRTKLAIEFMDNRLVASKTLAQEEQFNDSLAQLGRFTALMYNTLHDLKRNEYSRKALRNNKRFEFALRGFIPRLELVRRALPFSHSYHVSKLIKAVREARRESIEPFFGDTVLPDGL